MHIALSVTTDNSKLLLEIRMSHSQVISLHTYPHELLICKATGSSFSQHFVHRLCFQKVLELLTNSFMFIFVDKST